MKRLAAMGSYRLSMYLKSYGETELFLRFPKLLDSATNLELFHELEDEYYRNLSADTGVIGKLYRNLGIHGNAEKLAWCCLELFMFYFMEHEAACIFEAVLPSGKFGVTLQIATKLIFPDDLVYDCFSEQKQAYLLLDSLLLIRQNEKNFMYTPLTIDDRFLDYLHGGHSIELLDHNFIQVYEPKEEGNHEPVFYSEILEDMYTKLQYIQRIGIRRANMKYEANTPLIDSEQEQNFAIFAVTGEEQSGRQFLIKRLVERLGYRCIFCDAAYFGNQDTMLIRLKKLLRELLLDESILCITNLQNHKNTEVLLKVISREYKKLFQSTLFLRTEKMTSFRPLFLTADRNVKCIPYVLATAYSWELKALKIAEQARAWEYFSTCYLEDTILNARELAVKMKLSVGTIKKVVKRLIVYSREELMDSRIVFRCCYELLDDGRYENMKRVEARYCYEDLKLESEQKQILKDICAQVEYRRLVFDEWNLKSRYAYGTCISALFTGPPGTGKTMAVHVLAAMLGLELYQVDLSQLVDKYIGETEKRLEEIFTKAEKSNMILFFDEADAVIGKRSEVKEAKDKYANSEISYLLQRMEEYDGIVILASNYSQNIDSAFMRRIRFTVHFPLPDVKTRKEIWISSFADEVPKGTIDFEYLSSQFEFSGGQIKNTVLNAVFFAAAEHSEVQMEHLVRAIQLELTKDKKISFLEALGEYAHLVF